MACAQVLIYSFALAFELGGLLLAGVEAIRAHRALGQFNDPEDPDQHTRGFGPDRLTKAAVQEVLGGRGRRMLSVALLAFGAVLATAGNFVGLWMNA